MIVLAKKNFEDLKTGGWYIKRVGSVSHLIGDHVVAILSIEHTDSLELILDAEKRMSTYNGRTIKFFGTNVEVEEREMK